MQFMHNLFTEKGQDSLKPLLCSQCCTCEHITVAALSCDPGFWFLSEVRETEKLAVLLETNNTAQRCY